MRKLASIQTISKLSPIENADNIEVAHVMGWKVIVKKGEFDVGEKVVYIEIDSILPERPEFEFMRKHNFRVRTLKLRGQVSQGIVFPLSILSNYDTEFYITEGMDITDILDVVKYEPPVPAQLDGKMKGKFPSFLSKSDQPRVQRLQDVLDKYLNRRFYLSEKLDGSSMTVYVNNGEFGVCSRNIELYESDDNTFWKMARELDLENKFRSLNVNIAIQGELIGENIQGNKYRLNGHRVRWFSAFDIDAYEYYDFNRFRYLMDEVLKLETVPCLDTDYRLSNNIDELVELSKGKSVLNTDAHREGIVFKLISEDDYVSEHVSFKAINPDFLLKYKE